MDEREAVLADGESSCLPIPHGSKFDVLGAAWTNQRLVVRRLYLASLSAVRPNAGQTFLPIKEGWH
jgi:hypothetical protein